MHEGEEYIKYLRKKCSDAARRLAGFQNIGVQDVHIRFNDEATNRSVEDVPNHSNMTSQELKTKLGLLNDAIVNN